MRPIRWLVAACVLALAACVPPSTQLVSSWRDPDAGPVALHKVLAVAMVRDESRRRLIEDRMVADIEKAGARAVPSYRLISTADARNDGVVKEAVLSGGFDGAVTWRTIASGDEAHYVPPVESDVPLGYRGFWGYYHLGWVSVYDPGSVQFERVVRVETMVYTVTRYSDRLVWAGTSDTIDPASLDSLAEGVADATIDAMRGEKMFAPLHL